MKTTTFSVFLSAVLAALAVSAPAQSLVDVADATFDANGFSNYSTMRFFGMKVWESGTIVHNYLPCFDRLTGVSGVYDTVEGKFFPNATGEHFESGKGVTGGLVIYIK